MYTKPSKGIFQKPIDNFYSLKYTNTRSLGSKVTVSNKGRQFTLYLPARIVRAVERKIQNNPGVYSGVPDFVQYVMYWITSELENAPEDRGNRIQGINWDNGVPVVGSMDVILSDNLFLNKRRKRLEAQLLDDAEGFDQIGTENTPRGSTDEDVDIDDVDIGETAQDNDARN